MGITETLTEFLAVLNAIPVTTLDGATSTLHSRIFNNQIENKKEGKDAVYQVPACFVELVYDDSMPITMGATGSNIRFRLLIEQNHYHTEGSYEQDLSTFDLVETIHAKCNVLKLSNCSPLQRIGTQMDYDHDNTKLTVIEYSSYFMDLKGSLLDSDGGVYVEELLVDPTIVIEQAIVDSIPTDPNPAVSLAMLDFIESVRVQQISSGKVGITILSATAPVGTTYSIFWEDGGIDVMEVGTQITHTYIDFDIEYFILIGSSNGAIMSFPITVNALGNIINCVNSIYQTVAPSINSIYYPNYPVSVSLTLSLDAGSVISLNYYVNVDLVANRTVSPVPFGYVSYMASGNNTIGYSISSDQAANRIAITNIINIS